MTHETWARYSSAILEKRLQNHVDGIAGIKLLTFLKRVNKMETLWTSNDCDHHFAVFNHVFHPFRGWLTRLNQNNFVARPQIEPRLIQSHKILPAVIPYGLQESEQFV
jgi:hypothetical protein